MMFMIRLYIYMCMCICIHKDGIHLILPNHIRLVNYTSTFNILYYNALCLFNLDVLRVYLVHGVISGY